MRDDFSMIDLNFRPQDMSSVISCLEVYKTDEEHFKPYISSNNLKSNDNENDKKQSENTNLDTILNNNQTFTLHQGKIIETYTYTNLISIEWSKDYEGTSGEARVSLPFHKKDLDHIYKGVRCCIKCDRYTENNSLEKPITETFVCFITDVKINQTSLQITLSSFDKLLEQKVQVNFSKMLRSQILKEVIKMSGFKPILNIKGLKDEVMDYTNINKSSSGTSEDGGTGDGKMSEEDITKLAKVVKYQGMGSNHDIKKGYNNLTKDHRGDCYDITAGLYYAYWYHLGIPVRDIVSPSSVSSSGTHHCCMIKKNGKWIFPPFYDSCTTLLKVSSEMKSGNYKVARETPSSGGTIPKYTYNK